jgi:DNA end-binding protein Ku
MRSIWKGAISFGLVNVPVKLYSATEDHDLSLHQVHDADGGRIRYQRRCEVCGKVVDYADIDKAYDDGNTTVVLTDDDLKSLPEERSREIEVVEFVPSSQIDPIMFDRSYFLEPDKTAVKAYALLRRALTDTDRTAIVQFSLRQKTRLGALRVRPSTGSGHGVLMLQSLLWDDEVRDADFPSLSEDVRVSAKEAEMASSLVENMGADFKPDKFSDEYQEQLRELIAAKLEQGDALDTAATFGDEDAGEAEGGQVVDLMEALRRSVAENRSKRGSSASTDEPTAGRKSTAKKTTAKKTTAKKTTAKQKAPTTKAATKKSPARKSATRKTA